MPEIWLYIVMEVISRLEMAEESGLLSVDEVLLLGFLMEHMVTLLMELGEDFSVCKADTSTISQFIWLGCSVY
jgi:hypothetical protein